MDKIKIQSIHLVVDLICTSDNLFSNSFVLHDCLLQAVINGIRSDSHDLVHPVILSKNRILKTDRRDAHPLRGGSI